MYLVVVRIKVIDTYFQAMIPAVPEILASDGTTVLQAAVPEVPEVAEVSHEEIQKSYMESSDTRVAEAIALGEPMKDYYFVDFNPALRPTLKTIREKSRTAAPAREVITIETQDGVELGSGVI